MVLIILMWKKNANYTKRKWSNWLPRSFWSRYDDLGNGFVTFKETGGASSREFA